MYTFKKYYIYILNIFIYECKYMQVNIFKIYTVFVCIYIYIQNIHCTHSNITICNENIFILDAINDSTNFIVI